MTGPFFSICIPNYNYGGYIGLTIESVLTQDFEDFEVVIVDNASTDASWDVIQRYAAKEPRVRTFRNSTNVGFAPNLQKASERANGTYIIMLSSDDLMKPGALSTYHRIISSKPNYENNVILHSAADHIDSEGAFKRLSLRFKKGEPTSDLGSHFENGSTAIDERLVELGGHFVLKHALLHAYSPATFCSTCYPRSLWDRVGGYDLTYQYQPDTAFLFKLLAFNPHVVYVNRSLFAYRIHANNQNANAIARGAIKQQIDKYHLSYQITDTVLDRIGVKRGALERTFLREYCFKESIRTLRLGYKLRAFKIFSFAFSTYPGRAVGMSWLYATLATNIFSFVLVWLPGFRVKKPT